MITTEYFCPRRRRWLPAETYVSRRIAAETIRFLASHGVLARIAPADCAGDARGALTSAPRAAAPAQTGRAKSTKGAR